jgi:16S rRNA (guanine1207-N2)-methyltransferase
MADRIMDPAVRLLQEAPPESGERVLLIMAGEGGLAAAFAARFGEVICHNAYAPLHAACAESTASLGNVRCVLGDLPMADRNDAGDPSIADIRYPEGRFDQIVFRLGRGTAQVNAALSESFRLLRPGGSLLVAGHNQEGIKSFAKRAEDHFGNMRLLRIKHSCRLLRFEKESVAPVKAVEDPRYFEPIRLELEILRSGAIGYFTKPGIFAYRATDPGTAMLAAHLPDCRGRDVMDLCSGSGVLSLAASALGARSVRAVDSSAIAAACARRNFALHGVAGEVRCAGFEEDFGGRFDLILANPPFHRDSETDFSLPSRILDAIAGGLRPGGEAFLVANAFLDYASPAKSRFARSEIVARDQSYAVHRLVSAP